jgi:hypothetical protein
MKTRVGTLLVSQSGQRKRKPLEGLHCPFSTTIAQASVILAIAVTRGFRQFRANQRPSLHLEIETTHPKKLLLGGVRLRELPPRGIGWMGSELPKSTKNRTLAVPLKKLGAVVFYYRSQDPRPWTDGDHHSTNYHRSENKPIKRVLAPDRLLFNNYPV